MQEQVFEIVHPKLKEHRWFRRALVLEGLHYFGAVGGAHRGGHFFGAERGLHRELDAVVWERIFEPQRVEFRGVNNGTARDSKP